MNIRDLLGGMSGETPVQPSPALSAEAAAAVPAQAVQGAGTGRLPQRAALAMTYTPMQGEPDETFDPKRALERGTLFPGLELPLFNNYRVSELPRTPMTETQALCFAAQELALYLDTHPEDSEALRAYQLVQQAANRQTEEFSRRCYPLTRAQNTEPAARYVWAESPWPWQTAGSDGRRTAGM